MLYLVDTNVLIHVLRRKKGRREFLRELVRGGGNLACSAITIGEIHAGMREHERAQTLELLMGMEALDVTAEIAALAGRWKGEWAAKGIQLTLADMMIAATAKVHGAVLVTENLKDFPQPGLRLLGPEGEQG